jgi:hypothetical protein
MFKIPILELHAAHSCNLTCESCSHFSNSGHRGMVSPEEMTEWIAGWKTRIFPELFRLLGGEATLNPRLTELIMVARRGWPDSTLALTTNGFFLHRHRDLGETLGRAGVLVHLSIHDDSDEYLDQANRGFELLQEWRDKYGVKVSLEVSANRWTRRYLGFGPNVLPFADGDRRSSWQVCPAKSCRQLFRNRLWKCSPITYLHLQKETFPELSPAWDAYLAYDGLSPTCSDEELARFVVAEDESICAMCPATVEYFSKPSPLLSRADLLKRARERVRAVGSDSTMVASQGSGSTKTAPQFG